MVIPFSNSQIDSSPNPYAGARVPSRSNAIILPLPIQIKMSQSRPLQFQRASSRQLSLCLRHIVFTALRSATSLGVASRYVCSSNKPSPQPLPVFGSPASRGGHRAAAPRGQSPYGVTFFALASVHSSLPCACSSSFHISSPSMLQLIFFQFHNSTIQQLLIPLPSCTSSHYS